MNSRDIRVSQDGKIFIAGTYRGFIEDDQIYIIEMEETSRPIGDFSHRSEITTVILEWYEGKR